MKRLIAFLLTAGMLLFSLVSCNTTIATSGSLSTKTEANLSEKEPVSPTKPAPPSSGSSGGGLFSKEAMEKIQKIYSAANTEKQTVTTVQQLAILTSICAFIEGTGPISVTPAQWNGEEITLVTLGGTQNVKGQATSMKESALASKGKQNDYLTAVEKLVEDGTIPENKPLLIAGISLGGMIAQQMAGKTELLKKHHIELKQIICFGSPFTYPIERNGIPVVRFTDENDSVPKMGENALLNGLLGKLQKEQKDAILRLNEEEKIFGKGQYQKFEAHALSYISESCWDLYDFSGSTEKNNVLVLTENMSFYPAPKLS